MTENKKKSFSNYLANRIDSEKIDFFAKSIIQKAYYTGAYARAVISSSWHSSISKKNETFKNWLSNQIINHKNLERIYEIAFRYEQKLQLKIWNGSEVRSLVHEVPVDNIAGVSNAKISFAFVAGFDDYLKFTKDNKEKYQQYLQQHSIVEENENE